MSDVSAWLEQNFDAEYSKDRTVLLAFSLRQAPGFAEYLLVVDTQIRRKDPIHHVITQPGSQLDLWSPGAELELLVIREREIDLSRLGVKVR